MRTQAGEVGFHLGEGLRLLREPGEFPPDFVSRPDRPAAKLFTVNLRRATPDSAVVSVFAVTASIQERVEWADLMVFTFARQERLWTLVDTKRETGEMERW
jgi:hypothetical protein